MDPSFHTALLAFAAEQDRTPGNVLLHAGKAMLSKYGVWRTGTQGRPFARVRKAIQTDVGNPVPGREAVGQTGRLGAGTQNKAGR